MDQPQRTVRFSVLIPVFNRPNLVRLTLDSVLAQTFPDYEVIVVDDGSTDQTIEVLESYGSRIKLLQQRNGGAEAARYKGAEIAIGEYFVLLDSDDLLYPTALASYDRVIRDMDGPPVIVGAMSYFSDGSEPVPNASGDEAMELVRFPDYFAKDRTVALSCSVIVLKRSAAAASGALRKTSDAFPFDGTDIMFLAGACGPCIWVKKPFTVAYRLHATNTVQRLDYLLNTAACLARFERLGQYPGGARRRFERYSCIGGVTWHYTALGLKRGLYRLSFRLLLQTFPLVLSGFLNKILRRFRKPTALITLSI